MPALPAHGDSFAVGTRGRWRGCMKFNEHVGPKQDEVHLFDIGFENVLHFALKTCVTRFLREVHVITCDSKWFEIFVLESILIGKPCNGADKILTAGRHRSDHDSSSAITMTWKRSRRMLFCSLYLYNAYVSCSLIWLDLWRPQLHTTYLPTVGLELVGKHRMHVLSS